jgi:predicted Fe-Mo cluster-binding NifX family protein
VTKLPAPIAAYIDAENSGDTEALAQCFAEQAVVRDEGKTIEGLAAIKQWKAETGKKYQHTIEPIEPIESVQKDGRTIVTNRLSGNFPGSPIELELSSRSTATRSRRWRSSHERHLELKGRRALVTGGTQGIGAAVVARLREAGVMVLTAARTTPAELADETLSFSSESAEAPASESFSRSRLYPPRRGRSSRAGSGVAADRGDGNVRAATGAVGHRSVRQASGETDRDEADGGRDGREVADIQCAILELHPDAPGELLERFHPVFHAKLSLFRLSVYRAAA